MTENPFSTQGWNRYAYVGNSPLNFADPSGYCFQGCFWQAPFKALGAALRRTPILGNILQIAAAAICTAGTFGACSPIAAAFISSAVVTGLASGDLGQALKAGAISAATAAAFQGVGDLTGNFAGTLNPILKGHSPLDFLSDAHLFNIAGHAAVGCGSAVASGGKCGPGALSGAAGSFAGPLTRGLEFTPRLVVTSVAGGLASVAGGGKFGNGALTAAFGYLFNEVALACRATATLRGAGSHCGLFVFDRSSAKPDDLSLANIRGQFSLGRAQKQFNTDQDTSVLDRATFQSGEGVYLVAPHLGCLRMSSTQL